MLHVCMCRIKPGVLEKVRDCRLCSELLCLGLLDGRVSGPTRLHVCLCVTKHSSLGVVLEQVRMDAFRCAMH
jgi:hypothetical protein